MYHVISFTLIYSDFSWFLFISHAAWDGKQGFHRIASMMVAEFEQHAPKLLRKLQAQHTWDILGLFLLCCCCALITHLNSSKLIWTHLLKHIQYGEVHMVHYSSCAAYRIVSYILIWYCYIMLYRTYYHMIRYVMKFHDMSCYPLCCCSCLLNMRSRMLVVRAMNGICDNSKLK